MNEDNQCFCQGGLYENEANSTNGIMPIPALLGFDEHSGIMLDEENGKHYLTYDNSAGEYARGAVEIKYCPICGREL